MLKPASSPTEQLKGRWGVTARLLLSVLLCLTLLPTQALAVQEAADSKSARSNEVEAAAAMPAADPATSTVAAVPADIKEKPSLTARAHVQTYGWTTSVANVKPESIIGTYGKRKRMEALRLSFSSKRGIQGGITYRAHVQTCGWQSWVSDGAMAGTSGKAKRIEAVQIKLTGDMAKRYDVYYQAHVQKVGWTAWAKNGQTAGSSGLSYRMEALRIQLVEKGGKAPAAVSGDGGTKSYWTVQSTTRAHVQKTGTMIAKGHQLTATCTLGKASDWRHSPPPSPRRA